MFEGNYLVIAAFMTYMIGVFALGLAAHKLLSRGAFLGEYFLGGKNLGVWTLALTFASTAASGGTFMGFPALVYHNGWIVALWIASYMMVPLVTMGVFGRRLNQLGHMTKALTVSDVFRDRFQMPSLGLVSTALIIVLLAFNLVSQFVAGGRIMARVMAWPTVSYIENVDAKTKDGRKVWLTQAADASNIELVVTSRDGTAQRYEAASPRELRAKSPEAYDLYRAHGEGLGWGYIAAVAIFALVVVIYTAYGGFWAVVWTDVFQGIWMMVGMLILLPVALIAAGGLDAATTRLSERSAELVTGPGPGAFHPTGIMISYLLMWSISGMGQPASMWRLMAFKNTRVLSRSIFAVMIYYSLIYIPIVLVFICASSLEPRLPVGAPDDAMPVTAVDMSQRVLGDFWGPLLGGAVIAAPFAAIMSTVDSFLLMISSGLVRDIYQRNVNPNVSEKTVKRLTYSITALVGIGATLIALQPPRFLQYIIVFTGQGLACTLLAPMVLCLFWRRATGPGAMASMVAGFVTCVGLYAAGWLGRAFGWLGEQMYGPRSELAPIWLLDLEPLIWGLVASFTAGIVVSLATKPPHAELVDKLFPPESTAPPPT